MKLQINGLYYDIIKKKILKIIEIEENFSTFPCKALYSDNSITSFKLKISKDRLILVGYGVFEDYPEYLL